MSGLFSLFATPAPTLHLSDPQVSLLFNVACLYAFICFVFGLLSLQNPEHQRRAQAWQQYYGSPETAFQLSKQQQLLKQRQIAIAKGEIPGVPQEQSRFFQSLDFLYYFFIRPTVLVAALFAMIILRNYQNSIMSMVLAFGFSAGIAASWSNYPTKFIPGACVAIGFAYGTIHLWLGNHLPTF